MSHSLNKIINIHLNKFIENIKNDKINSPSKENILYICKTIFAPKEQIFF